MIPSKILVTGAAGFIASRVCEMLLEKGEQVVGIDNMNRGVMLLTTRYNRAAARGAC